VELIQYAPFKDPLYININGSYLAIRKETALNIEIDKIEKPLDL
jgi:ferrous iron transport protein A